MTLAETIQQKLADKIPHSGRHDFAVAAEDDGWSLRLTLDRQDELGCLVWELAIHRAGPAPADGSLRSWAEQIASNATGLLEPLKVIEIDDQRNEGLLRSDTPTLRKGKLCYHELLLQGTRTALLRRYQAPADGTGKREQIAFAVTNEGLAKLADGLTR
jgi:hypothetical protein